MIDAARAAIVELMRFAATSPVTWRREDGPDYLGTVAVADCCVRLVGRDPESGIDVSLSVPFGEIEHVSGDAADVVVLELTGSSPIRVRGAGADSLRYELSRRPCSSA